MRDKENKLYVVIRFNGAGTLDYYQSLSEEYNTHRKWQAKDLLLNACEMRQENNLLVFLIRCSELHEKSYGITDGKITMMYSIDDLKPITIDVYTRYRDIQW